MTPTDAAVLWHELADAETEHDAEHARRVYALLFPQQRCGCHGHGCQHCGGQR